MEFGYCHRLVDVFLLTLSASVDDLFLVVALKDRLNMPPNLTRPAKIVLKIDSCTGWGHFVSWRCTYTFSL